MTGANAASFDEVFEAVEKSVRGTLRCRICDGYVPVPPADAVERLFWPGERHLRGHPWPCSRCPRAFLSPAGLKRHQVAKHPRDDEGRIP